MKVSVCVSHISALKVLMAVLAIFAVKAGFAVVLENEDKAYGELHSRIVERIRLWPGFAPHEKESSLGRYAYDTKNKVWRRRDVSQPELVLFRPFGKLRDTMVIVMPGGGYDSQHMGHFCRDSRPILESGR